LIFSQNPENTPLVWLGILPKFSLLKGFLDLFEVVLQPKKSSMWVCIIMVLYFFSIFARLEAQVVTVVIAPFNQSTHPATSGGLGLPPSHASINFLFEALLLKRVLSKYLLNVLTSFFHLDCEY
jgi:hypothetical protein